MSIHPHGPPRPRIDIPFTHDADSLYRHLRQRGMPAGEALATAKKRFPSGSGAATSSASPSPSAEELTRLRTEKRAADQRIAALERDLACARERIVALERDLAAASARTSDPLFQEVGLDAGCPDYLIVAARKAFRKQYHPDHRPAHEKAEAEAAFKRFEGLFAQIFAVRGLR